MIRPAVVRRNLCQTPRSIFEIIERPHLNYLVQRTDFSGVPAHRMSHDGHDKRQIVLFEEINELSDRAGFQRVSSMFDQHWMHIVLPATRLRLPRKPYTVIANTNGCLFGFKC
jgi:hypothetical protein